MSGFLLDTNVVSELIRPKPAQKVVDWIDAADEDLLFLSVLTLGEIGRGLAQLTSSSRRTAIQSWLESALRPRFAGRILPVDDAVAWRWGLLAAAAAKAGKPVPVIDGLLAATALEHNLTLVTRDTSDVAGAGVPVLNPWI